MQGNISKTTCFDICKTKHFIQLMLFFPWKLVQVIMGRWVGKAFFRSFLTRFKLTEKYTEAFILDHMKSSGLVANYVQVWHSRNITLLNVTFCSFDLVEVQWKVAVLRSEATGLGWEGAASHFSVIGKGQDLQGVAVLNSVSILVLLLLR